MYKRQQVLYCGPIAPADKPAKGGYEAANRRNIDYLRSDFEVIELSYPDRGGDIFVKMLDKLSGFLLLILKIFWRRITGRGAAVFHITPLFKGFVYLEYLLVLAAKVSGYTIVLDIRAGSFIHYYDSGSELYKRLVRSMVSMAGTVLVEGKVYIGFIEKIGNKQAHYFPNYTDEVGVSLDEIWSHKKPLTERISLLYFGRVTRTKGVDKIVTIARKALELNVSIDVYLIGDADATDTELLAHLPANVHYLPLMGRKEMIGYMERAHFFVFPTVHTGEGQSNSLTEAIAYGLVPICSDNGFNTDIVGGSGTVLGKGASAQEYLDHILGYSQDEWQHLSVLNYEKAKKFYTPGNIELLKHFYKERNN